MSASSPPRPEEPASGNTSEETHAPQVSQGQRLQDGPSRPPSQKAKCVSVVEDRCASPVFTKRRQCPERAGVCRASLCPLWAWAAGASSLHRLSPGKSLRVLHFACLMFYVPSNSLQVTTSYITRHTSMSHESQVNLFGEFTLCPLSQVELMPMW